MRASSHRGGGTRQHAPRSQRCLVSDSRSDLDVTGFTSSPYTLRGDSASVGHSARLVGRLRLPGARGYHNNGWRYYRDFDPTLASIRGEPEFKAAFAKIEAEMAAQRARLAARPKDAPLEFEQIEKLVAAGAPADKPT